MSVFDLWGTLVLGCGAELSLVAISCRLRQCAYESRAASN